MTETGSEKWPMPSLLMGIYSKLGSLEAMTLANRQLTVDRTEMIRREVLESIRAHKEEVFPRFQRVEEEIERTDDRLRQLEISHGLAPNAQSWLLRAVTALVKAIPLQRLAPMIAAALVTAAVHTMPAEVRAVVKPVVAPILELLKGGPK